MLKEAIGVKKVILVTGKTDLRLGIDGLAQLVRLEYGIDPIKSGALFLFCGRQRDRIKGLIWDGDGYCMLVKRLSRGVYQWPRNSNEARALSKDEFKRLMSGFTVESSIPVSAKSRPANSTRVQQAG